VQWLAVSLVLSVVLTVVLNVALRLLPRASERAATQPPAVARPGVRKEASDRSTVRVHVPWRAMLLGSLLLTVVLNVMLWLR
jgi:type VI protein secretion system component VasF